MRDRRTCPACRRPVATTAGGRLYRHGMPQCSLSGLQVVRIWPAVWRGRRVTTIPGPDTWNPNALEGAA